MNGYIHISANGFLKPSAPSHDYFNLQLVGVSPNAYDAQLKPVVHTCLENLPCHPGFQTYPNLYGNLGVLEVIPVPTPELIDQMANPLYGMPMPVPFKGSFPQHHIGLCLTPTATIQPLLPFTFNKREYPTHISIVQFEPNSGCYQLINLTTHLNALEFEVTPREPNPHQHHFVETQEWVDTFKAYEADIELRASLLSMNKVSYMHRLFDRVDITGDMVVAESFLPDFLAKREEYLKSFFTVDTSVDDSDSSSDSESYTDSDDLTAGEFDNKLAQLKSLLPEVVPSSDEPQGNVIENLGAEVDIGGIPPVYQVVETPALPELAYMEADDEVHVQPPGGLDASVRFNETVVGVLRNYLLSARAEAALEEEAQEQFASAVDKGD